MKNEARNPNEQIVAHPVTHICDGSAHIDELEPEAVQAILRANDQIEAGQFLTSDQMRERLRREVFRK